MLSFNFNFVHVYTGTLFLTGSLANGLTIFPISVIVTQLVPVTVTWSRQAGDPTSWFLAKKGIDSPQYSTVTVPEPGAQSGELLVTFTTPRSFHLIAVTKTTTTGISIEPFGPLKSKDPGVNLPFPTRTLTRYSVFATLQSVTVLPRSTSTSGVVVTTSETFTETPIVPPSSETGSPTSIQSSNSSSTEESHSQPNTDVKVAMILGGIAGSVVCMLLAGLLVLCRRAMKRISGEASRRGRPTPFQSHLDINQSSGSLTEFMINDQTGSEGRGDSEMATVDGGDQPESAMDSVATGRNAQIPIQRQFRSAGRVFNKMKVAVREKKKVGDSNCQEVSDQMAHRDVQGAGGLTSEASSVPDRVLPRNNRTRDVLRHSDSGFRMMPPYSLTRIHETRPTDGGKSESMFEDTVELPPEYSFV
ncbi:hypothetical protein K435DRAFT_857442 [Dendrothele bispora CBS 962.96]|uniref:Uncharacterized protein n=1 Tax=Dendrothele bispora (strain CBS 962.96) TaxID=1314807 RepID=A0A4S8M6B5_DENBC|nr:hypothetical protein K435DRAFT_857442 [Dendrothele bispora CBS 962.96]